MFNKVLIANRGAIACRIIRTLRDLGVASVAVYTRADAQSLHVRQADEAVCIGESLASDTYLDTEKILAAAVHCGAEAIHPGYGFLSENAAFAESCSARGIVFIGPTPGQLRDFGLKHTARDLAAASGMPMLPGTGLLTSLQQALDEASLIGYPVMLKSTAGGGGIGMQQCEDAAALSDAFDSVQRLGRNNFAHDGIFLEKYVARARHIEVQVFGDGEGRVVCLGERDCSLQRRNQKVVEETPAPNLSQAVRESLLAAARKLGESVAYRSAGTVEYVYDPDSEQFYFLEVNTRLQVEHGVTEEVFGIDLVAWMIQLAAGDLPSLSAMQLAGHGHAVQVRLYAEDPARDFQPCAGLLTEVEFAQDTRCETWVEAGVEVTPFYDPMLAKLIVKAPDRSSALQAMQDALAHTRLSGFETNLEYLRQVLADPVLEQGEQTTRYLNQFKFRASIIEVLSAGTQSTIQDYPGRQGYWDVGVPPSGPMDSLALRLGNRLLDNPADAAGIEFTINGPSLLFHAPAMICLCGASMQAQLDGSPIPAWQAVKVYAGATLRVGAIAGAGVRSYLCVQGGIQVPRYLGSRSTFALGQFGGHGGRPLRVGDILHIPPVGLMPSRQLPRASQPEYRENWTLRVIYGPHGAPDFFTDRDMQEFFDTDWEVHYNSSRTGIRLIGPKPEWARSDGGEAGLHPSNIHDNAYAIGTVDFTGDMPVILGPDGPSLGGFVCPATVITADRWKLGQLRPGNTLRFVCVDQSTANALERAQNEWIETLDKGNAEHAFAASDRTDPVLLRVDEHSNPVAITYRPSGDRYLLVEYGPQVLDIELRFRVHALMLKLQAQPIAGVLETTPGIRSLQIHYDSLLLPLSKLVERLRQLEVELGGADDLEVPTRIIHLPLSWDDPSTQLAIDKYMKSVRSDAPWCPSNIEFIRRINGLDSVEEVRHIVFDASYLVMGLGDVYLGAPVATPMDPRHRLVTTKYNPARTWTPENAVGIGGSYLCVYGMEGPGGYQFVGRTLQMWNRYRQTTDFTKPWLLRFFDQIRFYPVSEQELVRLREDFPLGRFNLKVESSTFSLRDYKRFLADNAASIDTFKARQQTAFEEERSRWQAAGQDQQLQADLIDEQADELVLSTSETALESHVHGSVWQLDVEAGTEVSSGQRLMILESMKMEIALHAEHAGVVQRLLCAEGEQVEPGQPLLVISTGGDTEEQVHA